MVAEYVAGTGGIGSGLAFRILEAGYRLNIPRMFAALFRIAFLSVVIFMATTQPRNAPDIAAATAALAYLDLDLDQNPVSVRAKSRDIFWYSPVLKDRLDHVVADFAVSPKTEAEGIEVLRTRYTRNVPVTTRGAGTGNYGQAMPLAGGCILHLHKRNAVRQIHPGRVIVEPGCLLKDIDAACIAHSGQAARMFSSTGTAATIGGVVAGGVGSVRWGGLRDPGNIIRLRVVTMEAEPRALDFTYRGHPQRRRHRDRRADAGAFQHRGPAGRDFPPA